MDDLSDSVDNDNSNILNCIQCPNGADCTSIGTRLSLMETLPKYWRNSINSVTYHECLFPHRCNGGFYSECDTAFDGWMCLQCNRDNGYIRAGNSCLKCP